MPTVSIPDLGVVSFPDEMSEPDITAAVQRLHADKQKNLALSAGLYEPNAADYLPGERQAPEGGLGAELLQRFKQGSVAGAARGVAGAAQQIGQGILGDNAHPAEESPGPAIAEAVAQGNVDPLKRFIPGLTTGGEPLARAVNEVLPAIAPEAMLPMGAVSGAVGGATGSPVAGQLASLLIPGAAAMAGQRGSPIGAAIARATGLGDVGVPPEQAAMAAEAAAGKGFETPADQAAAAQAELAQRMAAREARSAAGAQADATATAAAQRGAAADYEAARGPSYPKSPETLWNELGAQMMDTVRKTVQATVEQEVRGRPGATLGPDGERIMPPPAGAPGQPVGPAPDLSALDQRGAARAYDAARIPSGLPQPEPGRMTAEVAQGRREAAAATLADRTAGIPPPSVPEGTGPLSGIPPEGLPPTREVPPKPPEARSALRGPTMGVGDSSEPPASALPRWLQREVDLATEHFDLIRQGRLKFSGGLDQKTLRAYVAEGAAMIYRGASKFSDFSTQFRAAHPEMKVGVREIFQRSRDFLGSRTEEAKGALLAIDDLKRKHAAGTAAGGERWYEDQMGQLRAKLDEAVGPDLASVAMGLQGAYSPRVKVGRSIQLTVDALQALQRGEPLPQGVTEHLADEFLSTGKFKNEPPKVTPYVANLEAGARGEKPPKVVVDSVMSQMFGFGESPTELQRRFISQVVEQEGGAANQSPGQAQAASWVGHQMELGNLDSARSFAPAMLEELDRRRNEFALKRTNIDDILDTTAKTGGDTYNVAQQRSLRGEDLYAVSPFPERTMQTTEPPTRADMIRFMTKNRDLLRDPRVSVGVWHDEANGVYDVDAVLTLADRQLAEKLGSEYNQKAIFGLKNDELIDTGGTGEATPGLPKDKDVLRALDMGGVERAAIIAEEGGAPAAAGEFPHGLNDAITVEHYSKEPRPVIDPEKMGTNRLSRAERARGAEEVPAAYVYLKGTPPEPGLGNVKHTARVPRGEIYNFSEDPKGYLSQAGGDITDATALAKKDGWDGFAFPSGDQPNVIAMFRKLTPDKIEVVSNYLDQQIAKNEAALAEQRGQRKGTVLGAGAGAAQDFVEDLPLLAKIAAAKLARNSMNRAKVLAEMRSEYPGYKDRMGEVLDNAMGTLKIAMENAAPAAEAAAPAGGAPPIGKSPIPSEVGSTVLKEQVSRRATEAAFDLFKRGDVKRDPEKLISDQVMELLSSEKIPIAEADEILKKHGMTFVDLGEQMFRPSVSDAARRLQALSALERKISQLGLQGPEAKGAIDKLAQLRADLKDNGGDRTWWRRVEGIRKRLLVAQLATSVRNALSQGGMAALDVIDAPLQSFLQKGRDLVTSKEKAAPDVSPLDGISQLGRLISAGKTKSQVAAVLDAFPRQQDRLFGNYASDISKAAKDQGFVLKGVDKVFTGLEKAGDAINVLNQAQEYFFRRGFFAARLDQHLRPQGGLEAVLAKGKGAIEKIPLSAVEDSVDLALEKTFAQKPTYGTFTHYLTKVLQVPPLSFAIPFSRFMVNAWKFYGQRSPLGFLSLLSKGERAKIAAGDMSTLSKAAVGTGMLGAAYLARNSEYAGDKWYEIYPHGRDEKGKPIGDPVDVRPFNPFASYMFVADLMKRKKDGTLFQLDTNSFLQGVFSANLRAGTGLAVLDDFMKGAEEKFSNMDAAGRSMKEFAGGVIGGLLNPLQTPYDILAQFNPEMQKLRDTGDEPLLGQAKTKIPIPSVQRSMPERKVPTREETPLRERPAARQLTGITFEQPRNAIERELDRLQFTPSEILPRSGDPEFDRLASGYMGTILGRIGPKVVDSNGYQKLSTPARQRLVLDRLLIGRARKEAVEAVHQNYPQVWRRVKLSRLPGAIKAVMEQDSRAAPSQESESDQ